MRTNSPGGALVFCCLVLTFHPAESFADEPRLADRPGGPPVYVGNLSVDLILRFGGHAIPPQPDNPATLATTPEGVRRLRSLGAFSVTDILLWPWSEKTPGAWDFSPYLKNADQLRQNGLEYNPFCWVHYPPLWYRDSPQFVPATNLATGDTLPQISIWSPDLGRVYDDYYRHLAAAMGDRISFLRLAMPSDYGELGFPAGMTNWLIPQPHAGPAFWCGDADAKRDFQARSLAKYQTLSALNAAWGKAYCTADEIALPDVAVAHLDTAENRRYWLDFLDWYTESENRTLIQLAGIARRYFPGREIIASLGYGSERVTSGNDESKYLKTLGSLGLSCQSPANVGWLATQRVASASEFYRVPYYTEPPGTMNANQVLDRIFAEISHGTDAWFDYPQNLLAGRADLMRYRDLLDRQKPVLDVALWDPSADLYLRSDLTLPWSPATAQIAGPLRDAIDYHVFDDRMIRDGALEKMGIKCLVLAGARYLDRAAWQQVLDWCRKGGFFVVAQGAPLQDETGARDLWHQESGSPVPWGKSFFLSQNSTWRGKNLFDAGARNLGQGTVLTFDPQGLSLAAEAELLATLCLENGIYRGDRTRDAAWISPPKVDGVYAVRRSDSCVYYNSGTKSTTLTLSYRAEDFPLGTIFPPAQDLHLPPRSIQAVPLLDR